MDQGSYSRPDGRGHPTLSSSSAANNNYQVNVSRQKTKKWVEAKSQNYDGDEWGADEYEEDEVEPPLPLAPQGPQYGASHGAHNLPSLHIQTNPPSQPPQQHQPYPPPQSRPPPPANAQPRQVSNPPSSAHPSSAVPQSAGGFQPQSASSAYALSPRSPPDSLPSTTPLAATANKPLPHVRPSDIYRRMEEEKSRGSSDSSRPSADMGSNLSKQSSASPARTAAEPVRAQPTTAPIPAPRTDSHTNVYQNLTKPPMNHAPQQTSFASPPRSDVPVSQFATPTRDVAASEAEEEAKRLSTSPKLPDLARMSVFGADFFSSTGFSTSLSSEQMAEQNIPEVPKVAPELKVDKPATHKTNDAPAAAANATSAQKQSASDAPIATEKASIEHEIIAPTVYQAPGPAPKMAESTPSTTTAAVQPVPEPAKQTAPRASIDTASSSRSAASAADITPTKPLNVRKEESPVRSFEPPPPLQREPTFGTDTSSPVKESDMLRDEIIKTLNSPAQTSTETVEPGPADNERKPSQSRARDSTYTLQDYDSYWADTDTAPEIPPQPIQPQSNTMSIVPEEAAEAVAAAESKPPAPISKESEPLKSTEEVEPAAVPPPAPSVHAVQPTTQAPTSQHSASPAVSQVSQSTSIPQPVEASIVSPASTELRRKFSWEAEDISKPPKIDFGVAPPAATSTTAAPPVPTAGPAQTPAPALAAAAVPPTEAQPQLEITSPRERHSEPSPVASAATAAGAAVGAAAVVGADITAATTTSSNPQEPKRLSLADEKGLTSTTSNGISSPTDDHPALRLSDPAPAPVLSMPRSSGASVTPFKDIVNLNNSTERVAKFNETRVAFAVMDIGLDRWLTNLHQDHPEHHSKSFNSYQPAAAPGAVPPGAQQPAQQPYYQQYLNASAPSGGSSPGRRIGGISMPSNVGGSTFGHSGNQIGTKSKELMQSAGKMGKGLFSKGKNKLRGDKGDTHPAPSAAPPPPVQTKAKHDRSGSWAVLSNKLRTEFSSSKDHHEQQTQQPHDDGYYAAPRASMTIAPQIPVPEPVSPLLREATPDKSFASAQAQTASGQRSSGHHSTGATSAPLTSAAAISIPAASHQIRVVPSEANSSHGPAFGGGAVGTPAVLPPAAEDSGVGMLQLQPGESDDAPKRQSSFVGLPPIRRSSTFGMKSKARRAAERFPLDEDEDNGVPGLPSSDVMENPVSQPEAPPPQQTRREHLPNATVAQTGPSFQPPATTTDKDGIVVHHQPVSAEHSPERSAMQPALAPPSQTQSMRPNQPPHPPMMLHPGQSGPWRLEESHLAEPLHQAKNRSGHSPISPPMGYGFDKETGQMPPPPPPAAAANNNNNNNNVMRQRNTADVPPSSAQRYPGLFAPRPDQEMPPQQQQRQFSSSQAYYEEMANPRHSGSEFSIPGVGPPLAEDRGRAKRNSGIFREIGDKIARATSRDRKNSFADASRPLAHADPHADEASESSFGTEEMQDRKKKRRSSFLNTLTGRASMDTGSRQSFSALQRSQTESPAGIPNSSSEDLGAARKRSVFGGVMAGFNMNKNGPTSGLANQQSVSAADEEPQLTTPKKKRFSAITKAFQRQGNQERPSSGMSLEPTESAGSSQNHNNARGGIRSSMPFRNRDRSDSAAQMDAAAGSSDHSRRASFSNLLSSLGGNKGQQQQQQYHQYQNQPATPTRPYATNSNLHHDVPSPPRQRHAADDFPTPNRDAPTLPAQFLDRPQPLFAAGENKWGIDRPATSATVTASERPQTDAGESIASSTAIVPAISSVPLPDAAAATVAAAAETSAKRENPAVAPSEVSDTDTDIAENSRKPSDVTPSVMTGVDEESEEMTRQDTNVSQVTPSVVTDLPRPDEEQQQHTPTAQYPNSPSGYYTHNSRASGPTSPSAATPQGYTQEHPQGPVQHQQDPRRSLTGPASGPGMGQGPPGPHYGQHQMQHPNQQHQQYMHGGFAQPAQPSEPAASSSNRWKDLKTKMAGISQSSPNSKHQDKQDKGEKTASGDKLFNAFKRLSKQQGSAPVDAPPSPGAQASGPKRFSKMQPPVLAQVPQGMQPTPQGGETSPGFRVFPRNQGQPMMGGQDQQMPPHMQRQQVPPHMQHQQMQVGQGYHSQQGHPQPGHFQQGHPQQQLSMYMQQQQYQQQRGEPQYGTVPTPQGYNSAYSQRGPQAQNMYNVGRQYSQHQTPYQQQQNHASQYHHPQGHQAGGYQQHGNAFDHNQAQSPLSDTRRESQPHEPLSQQVSAAGSDLLSPVTQRSGSIPMSPTSDEPRSPHAALTREALALQDARKDLQAHHLRPEESHTSLDPSHSNRVSQVSNDSGRQRPSPKSQQSPPVSHKQLQATASTAAAAAAIGAAAASTAATSAVSPDNERHVSAASVSPPLGSSSDLASPSNGTPATKHAETILSPASPAPAEPLSHDLTGESKGNVSDDSIERKKIKVDTNMVTTVGSSSHVAELEDTAEARQRTIRIDGQEEKIAYDPEEENPKMSATSYPGQEWNPYGEPGFGDWQE